MKDNKKEENKVNNEEQVEEKKNDDVEDFDDLDIGVCSAEFQDGCM